jgi:2-isopropylmalate synthase
MKMTDRLIIFDTTLRDGEQSPGASMTKDEKVRIARQLERLRVDVIEAGFAAASPGDFEAVRSVAESVKQSTVCSLARVSEKDIRAAGEAIKPAARGRIHTFIATSPIHMEKKLRMSPDQVVEAAVKGVKMALEYTPDVEFSAEDAVRSEIDFLVRVFTEVIKAGATTINVPDTVGYSVPGAWGERFKQLIARTPGADKVVWSTHCHNDLGMAVANSLSAVLNGARQVECTINGLGERAGNASLEEIVMAVRVRKDIFNCDTGIDATQIVPASRLVSQITGYPVQPNKAVVGANAFAHESGIHQDGVLKHRETYEIMRAEDVGWAANKIVLGKLSGRNAFKQRLNELGIQFDTEQAWNDAFARFKELADRKSEIFDEDLQALASGDSIEESQERYKFVSLAQHSETGEQPQAKVIFMAHGHEETAQAKGNGPVDATVNAIESKVGSGSELLLFSVNAITTGTESQGEVTMRLARGGRVVNGVGADPDIVVASAKAYLNALNKLESKVERLNPQQP